MKQNLVFNPAKSKKLAHWNQSGDCCLWSGVACNKGWVIGLDLSEEFISGGLDNSSLFNLQYLQNLSLAYNEFNCPIPSQFGKLKNLRYLNLSNAGFEGYIPNNISYLTKLAILDLSTSFTSDHTLKVENPSVGMLLQNLTEITELYLDGVIVSAVGKEWSHALSSLLKLQVLSMSSCNLSGPIDSSLSKLQSLTILKLSFNNLSSSVPVSLVNLSNLTTLHLTSCGLNGDFPKGIFQIQKLRVLDISDNEDLCGSLPTFPKDGYLQSLNLSYTNFSGQLPTSVSSLKQLSTLDLSNCQFNGTLPMSLSGLAQLVHLDLSFNNFTGPLPSLNFSKNLNYLSLFENGFTGPITSTHWKGLLNLTSINLGDNFFNGNVPSTLFTLPSLRELTLSGNGFEGQLEEFPNASFSALLLVDLSNNKLQGTVPLTLFHLRKLNFLQLSYNQFNGTIRLDTFWRLPNLLTLGLSHNSLSVDTTFEEDLNLSSYPSKQRLLLASCKLKEFPAFLRNQPHLVSLELSDNQLQGVIPNWIWRFDDMIHLNLSNNFFTSLEGPFENLTSKAFSVDLHSNQLNGSIPIFTKNAVLLDYSNNNFSFIHPDIRQCLQYTAFLSLSNNSFHGEIPQSFCNGPFLRMLDLSHNNFNGSIPECLTSKSNSLRVLDLAGNKLTGSISDTISSSCNLRFLNLNGNILGGTIPKSLANCQSLEVLDFGNNMLSDKFPCFLRTVSTLKVLNLRSNKLHGPIGCQKSNGTLQMLHIVDLASNNFNGTLPGELLQSWTAMMGDEDEARTKSGNFIFDMYGFHHHTQLNNLLNFIGKTPALLLVKMEAEARVPPWTIQHMFSYDMNAYQFQFGGNYLDSTIVVNKGLQMKYVKIPSDFTSLDFSSNHFEGPIPQELMRFKALVVLNMSHNAFSGHIPSSLGNLTQIESLDMSSNILSGEIPIGIASLSFLQVLNLSFNHLAGRIPIGTQIQTFQEDSFEGNEGLCGPPLTKNCSDEGFLTPPESIAPETRSSLDWNLISAELGFTFGFGFVILPLIFFKKWRLWYNKHVEDLLCKIFPQLYFVYEQHGEQRYRSLSWRHG